MGSTAHAPTIMSHIGLSFIYRRVHELCVDRRQLTCSRCFDGLALEHVLRVVCRPPSDTGAYKLCRSASDALVARHPPIVSGPGRVSDVTAPLCRVRFFCHSLQPGPTLLLCLRLYHTVHTNTVTGHKLNEHNAPRT